MALSLIRRRLVVPRTRDVLDPLVWSIVPNKLLSLSLSLSLSRSSTCERECQALDDSDLRDK
jgi:hypothetical protein